MSILSSASRALRAHSGEKSAAEALLASELASLQARDEALTACIDKILEGHLDVEPRPASDPMSRAIGKLLEKLAASTSRDLDRMVKLSIQGSENAMSAAFMLSSSRDIDGRT